MDSDTLTALNTLFNTLNSIAILWLGKKVMKGKITDVLPLKPPKKEKK